MTCSLASPIPCTGDKEGQKWTQSLLSWSLLRRWILIKVAKNGWVLWSKGRVGNEWIWPRLIKSGLREGIARSMTPEVAGKVKTWKDGRSSEGPLAGGQHSQGLLGRRVFGCPNARLLNPLGLNSGIKGGCWLGTLLLDAGTSLIIWSSNNPQKVWTYGYTCAQVTSNGPNRGHWSALPRVKKEQRRENDLQWFVAWEG